MPAKPDEISLTELDLQSLARSDYGWVGDLTPLPARTRQSIQELLINNLAHKQVEVMISSLSRAFGQSVELTENHLRTETEATKVKPQKIGTKQRDLIRALLKRRKRSPENERGELLDEFARNIRNNPILEGLIIPTLEYRLGKYNEDLLASPDAKLRKLLYPVLVVLEYQMDKGITSGPFYPGHEFLAACYVECFYSTIGRLPSITWNADVGEHSGFSLEILRLMAIALNETQNPDVRRTMPVDMVTPFRKAIEKKKREINS